MVEAFKQFMDQIPDEYRDIITIVASDKVLLLKPNIYVPNVVLESSDYHFVFLTSNPPPAWIGEREYNFRRGRMVLIGSGVSFLTKASPPTNEYLSITINKAYLEDICQEVTETRDIQFGEVEFGYRPELIQTIARFENEVTYAGNSCPLMVQCISTQLVIELLRCTGVYNVKPQKYKSENRRVEKAIEYMWAYYNADLNIDDICKEVHLSPFYFIRMFKEHTGKTPHEYLMNIRLKQAKTLLTQDYYSIEMVARLCGFIHPGHFTTFFHRNMGITPSAFRKSITKR